jgi:hypothetical protein
MCRSCYTRSGCTLQQPAGGAHTRSANQTGNFSCALTVVDVSKAWQSHSSCSDLHTPDPCDVGETAAHDSGIRSGNPVTTLMEHSAAAPALLQGEAPGRRETLLLNVPDYLDTTK